MPIIDARAIMSKVITVNLTDAKNFHKSLNISDIYSLLVRVDLMIMGE